jgi:hypothetical protein
MQLMPLECISLFPYICKLKTYCPTFYGCHEAVIEVLILLVPFDALLILFVPFDVGTTRGDGP